MAATGDVTVFDVVVIGGGAAGMTAAKEIAHAGKRVALVEAERTGGDCLYTGCVPSKSLIATARLLQAMRRADSFGIDTDPPRLDLSRAMARKERIIARIGAADAPAALERSGVTVLHGTARLLGRRVVMVDGRALQTERLVIATGSRPAIPSIPGLAEAGFVTSDALMACTVAPARLAVIGAGPVGLELSQAFRRFGSAVTVVERADRVLPRDDAEIAALVQRGLAQEGIAFHLGAEVLRIARDGAAKRLTVRTSGGGELAIEADEIFVATGRRPNVEGLNLDAAGVEIGEQGIRVDRRLRTTAAHVWACGDVIGPPYFTHAADDQARTVARNVLGGRATWSGRAIPWATFTDPEAAGVGLTERAAREHYGDGLEVLRLGYGDIDRAVTDGGGDGLIKVLLAPGWTRGRLGGEVVGSHIAGERAGEIVQQFAFQMAWRLPAGMLAKTVQSYPTYSLGGRQAIGLHWARADGAATPSLIAKLWNRFAVFNPADERSDA